MPIVESLRMADEENTSPDTRPLSRVPIPDPTLLTTEQSNRLRTELGREDLRVETLLRTELRAAIRLIDEQFKVIESMRVEQKADTKEALNKAEAAIEKLDDARRRDIEEIKERLGKVEGNYVARESFETRMGAVEFGGRPYPTKEP